MEIFENNSKGAKINRQLARLEGPAKKAKEVVAGQDNIEWKKYARAFIGGMAHWHKYPASGLKLKFTNNVIRRQVELKIALLMDMNLGCEVVPREPGDEVTAALLDAAWRFNLERLDVKQTVESVVKDAVILGTGIGKVYWNKSKRELEVRRVDPRSFFVDGKASSFYDLRYCWEEQAMTLQSIKTLWPKADIKAIVNGGEQESDDGLYEDAETVLTSHGDRKMHYPTGVGTQSTDTTYGIPATDVIGSDEDTRYKVQEWWFKEEDGGTRKVVRINNVIVEDKKNPFGHGDVPYFRIIEELVPGRFWGDTSIRHAWPIQKELNVIESVIATNLHLTTANIVWNYSGSGVATSTLQALMGKPGQIFNVRNPAFTPKRDHPPPIQSNLFQYRDMLIDQIGKLMRMNEIVPPGARGWPVAGKIIEQMREAQLVEIRQSANYIVRGLKRMTELGVGTIQEFYKDDRYVRILGPLPAALEGLPNPQNPQEPIADSVDDETHLVRMNPDNMSGQFDTEVREAQWTTPSRKAVLDELKEMNERDPEGVTMLDLLELMDLSSAPGLKARIMRRLRKLAEAAEVPPPSEPMPPAGAMPAPMIDPVTGMPIDPATGMPVDPAMAGMPI